MVVRQHPNCMRQERKGKKRLNCNAAFKVYRSKLHALIKIDLSKIAWQIISQDDALHRLSYFLHLSVQTTLIWFFKKLFDYDYQLEWTIFTGSSNVITTDFYCVLKIPCDSYKFLGETFRTFIFLVACNLDTPSDSYRILGRVLVKRAKRFATSLPCLARLVWT